jgi:hypothetical protein
MVTSGDIGYLVYVLWNTRRYQDVVEIYSVSAETIINDGFSYSENA